MARTATKLSRETITRVAKKVGYVVCTDGAFRRPCHRCSGTGVVRPWGVCFRCHGARLEGATAATVMKHVREELELEAQRERNSGKTDAELRWEAQQADLQAQRDRNGGLTDLELNEQQAREEIARVAAAAEAEKQAAADTEAAGLAQRFVPGARQDFTGTITMRVSGPGKFGTWVLTKVQLQCGATLIYWNDLGDKGDAVTFTATIKEISTRDGRAQVVVQRAKRKGE
jgi:hypothetical protein